jgi:TRAP-type C4-dicarboxylate transport system permease small subunit
MMRDYKFRQTEWPRRKARSKTLRIVAVLLVAVALGLLGYAALQWFSQEPSAEATVIDRPSPRVIPLAIPPLAPAEAASTAEPAARPGQN